MAGFPAWYTFAGAPVESECYNNTLKIAVKFMPAAVEVPPGCESMYEGGGGTMRRFLRDGVALSTARVGGIVMELDEVIPDDILADKMRDLYNQCVRELGIPFAGGVAYGQK